MPTYYCSDCDCTIEVDTWYTPFGCIPTSDHDSLNIGLGGGGGELDHPDDGQGNGAVDGNSPFGMPFGLGLDNFMKDVCKWLPEGFCNKLGTIFKIIIIVLICLAILFLYNTFRKR